MLLRGQFERATTYSAGIDLFSQVEQTIYPHERALIPLGVWWNAPPVRYQAQFVGRSGLALRSGLIILAGLIDGDYPDEWKALVYNSSTSGIFKVEKGMKIVQAVITPMTELGITSNAERTGGFGSTGV